jgi:hypothetical protein
VSTSNLKSLYLSQLLTPSYLSSWKISPNFSDRAFSNRKKMSKRQKVFFFQLLFGLFIYLNTVDENEGMVIVKPMSLPFEDCGKC